MIYPDYTGSQKPQHYRMWPILSKLVGAHFLGMDDLLFQYLLGFGRQVNRTRNLLDAQFIEDAIESI